MLSRLSDEWLAAGHAVRFVVYVRLYEPFYYATDAPVVVIDADGDEVAATDLPPDGGQPAPASFGDHARATLALGRYLRRRTRPEQLVLANHSFTVGPVLRSPARCKFYYIQAYEPEYYATRPGLLSKVKSLYAGLSYRLPIRRIVNTPTYARYLPRLGRDPVVAPGLDLGVYYPGPRRKLREGRIRIGFVSRVEVEKGTRESLEAVERLAAEDSRVDVDVALDNLGRASSLERLTITPITCDEDLAEYYRGLDIVIAPISAQFGAPHYPAWEALACGTPLVTTDVMLCDDRNSWRCAPGSAESIYGVLREVIAADAAVVGAKIEAGLATARRQEWPAVAQRFLDIFAACT